MTMGRRIRVAGIVVMVVATACSSSGDDPIAAVDAPAVGSRFGPGDESSPPIDQLCDLGRLARFQALVWARPATEQSKAFGDDVVRSFDIQIDEVIVEPSSETLKPGSTITISTYSLTPGTFQGTAVGEMWVDVGSESARVVALHTDSYRNSRYMARGFDFENGVVVHPGCETDPAMLAELGDRVGIASDLDLLIAMHAEWVQVNECMLAGDEPCASPLGDAAERVSRGFPEPTE